MVQLKTKEQIIEELDKQEINPEGAIFYSLMLILQELEKLNSNLINDKKGNVNG